MTVSPATAVLCRRGLNALAKAFAAQGRTVVGPTVRDVAVVPAELDSTGQLPSGASTRAEAGRYRLIPRTDGAAFAHTTGPPSRKTFLHARRERLWSTGSAPGGHLSITQERSEQPPYTLLGVHPCDLRAVAIQGSVPARERHQDRGCQKRQAGAFLTAAHCTEPKATCFCVSMGSGPAADEGFYLALSEAGDEVLAGVPHRPADPETETPARSAVGGARDRMGRAMPPVGFRRLMGENREPDYCTTACPTCLCAPPPRRSPTSRALTPNGGSAGAPASVFATAALHDELSARLGRSEPMTEQARGEKER
ncbi:hypothetical protein [Streptomyces sp. S.PB5]|uniref:hypothetical protein n=1 Tax=Streptomyces sp. S.PB5 TaxID=3020844 RepID=UPI0025AF9490|nr:hypothetical protein [Streptomyces sp. S.PB5]MDN3027599.1 hypothetical protein [Streptomyces sp. S.PB5]